MREAATATIPATSANLGPGFDAFGLALALHNRFEGVAADEWSVEIAGEGAGVLPAGPDNRVARAMARVFAEAGTGPRAARIRCENAIPPGAGLGSSAAAVVGGLLLGDALSGAGLDREAVFALAAEIEGHPDNAAAALFGGFALCWSDGGAPRRVRIDPACGLAAVVVTSCAPLATERSRSLLPAVVPHADAAFTAGRAGLLIAGVALGDREAVRSGLADRLHEPYRASAVTDLEQVRTTLVAAGADGAVLSGAGPTVIGLVCGTDDDDALTRARAVAAAASGPLGDVACRHEPRALGIDRAGATLT